MRKSTILFMALRITLLETTCNIAPENGWLELANCFRLGFGLFSGAFAFSFRDGAQQVQNLMDSLAASNESGI